MASITNVLIIAALSLAKVSAVKSRFPMTNSTCSPKPNAFSNGYDAYGSITLPGPRVNDSYPQDTWTWSRYLVNDTVDSTFGSSQIWQTVGLKTDPLENLADPSLLPYTSCLIAFTGITPPSGAENDDGTCSSVFTSDCMQEIISKVNTTASSLSGSAGASSTDSCQLIMNALQGLDSKCTNVWTGLVASTFLPLDFTTPPSSPDGGSCPVVNPAESNATNSAFFAWSEGPEANEFDLLTQNPQPFILASWLKTPADVDPESTSVTLPSWADTQLMCIKVNHTESSTSSGSGSGSGSGSTKINGATSVIGGLQKESIAFVSLMVLVTLFL